MTKSHFQNEEMETFAGVMEDCYSSIQRFAQLGHEKVKRGQSSPLKAIVMERAKKVRDYLQKQERNYDVLFFGQLLSI